MSELTDFDLLWDYDNPEVTESRFQALLSETGKEGTETNRLQLMTQIARAQGLQRKFDEAHKTLDEVQKLLNPEDMVSSIRYLLERGRVYNSDSERAIAKSCFLQGWDLACEEGEDFYAVDAAHMMAICEKSETSLMWNEQAMKRAEASDEKRARVWLGTLYNNTGWTYHDIGEFEKALELFEKGVAWRERHPDEQAIRVAKWAVARTLRPLASPSFRRKLQWYGATI